MRPTEPLQRLNKSILKTVDKMAIKICKGLSSPKIHCQVEGFPIKNIIPLEDGRTKLEGEVRYIYCSAIVSKTWMQTHNPKLGGYFVKYPNDNHEYFSSSKFEEEFEEYTEGNLGF